MAYYQLKLIVLFVLTVCTFLQARRANNKPKKQEALTLQEVQQQQVAQPSLNQTQIEEQPVFQNDFFTKIDNQLFPSVNPTKSTQLSEKVQTSSTDYNDIFGAEMKKCLKGTTFRVDESELILRIPSPQQMLFEDRGSRLPKTNDDYLWQLRDLLRSNKNFLTQDQNVQYNHVQMRMDLEPTPMEIQYRKMPENIFGQQNKKIQQEIQEQSDEKTIIKRKGIAKKNKSKKRLFSSRQGSLQTQKKSKKPLLAGLNNKFLYLDQEIAKRQQQLQVLKRIQHQRKHNLDRIN